MIKVDWLPAGVLLRELAHRLQILPANEKLGLEADEISQTLLLLFIKPHSARHHQLRGLKTFLDNFLITIRHNNIQDIGVTKERRLVAAVASATAGTGTGAVAVPVTARG
jgi:hypothetical protein